MKIKNIKHKKLALCILFAVVISLVIGAAVAYLTSKDSKENVFILGDVSIELWEKFDTNKDGLITGFDDNNNEPDYTDTNDEVYGPGEDPIARGLFPGVNVKKAPWIKNTGDAGTYVYMDVKIPFINKDDLGEVFGDKIETVPGAEVEGQPLFDIWHYDDNGDLVAGFNTDDWQLMGVYYPSNLSGSVLDKTVANNVVEYLFAYKSTDTDDVLNPENVTPSLFDEVSIVDWISEDESKILEAYFLDSNAYSNAFAIARENLSEDIVSAVAGIIGSSYTDNHDRAFSIVINGYAIQSELDERANVSSSEDAWAIYANQQGWNSEQGDSAITLYWGDRIPMSNSFDTRFYNADEGFEFPAPIVDASTHHIGWVAHSKNDYEIPLEYHEGDVVSKNPPAGSSIKEVPLYAIWDGYTVATSSVTDNGISVNTPSGGAPFVGFVYASDPDNVRDADYNVVMKDGQPYRMDETEFESTLNGEKFVYNLTTNRGYLIAEIGYFASDYGYKAKTVEVKHGDGKTDFLIYSESTATDRFTCIVNGVTTKYNSNQDVVYPPFNEYDIEHGAINYKTYGYGYVRPGDRVDFYHGNVEANLALAEDGTNKLYKFKFDNSNFYNGESFVTRQGKNDDPIVAPELNFSSTYAPDSSIVPVQPENVQWKCVESPQIKIASGGRYVIDASVIPANTDTLTFEPDTSNCVIFCCIDPYSHNNEFYAIPKDYAGDFYIEPLNKNQSVRLNSYSNLTGKTFPTWTMFDGVYTDDPSFALFEGIDSNSGGGKAYNWYEKNDYGTINRYLKLSLNTEGVSSDNINYLLPEHPFKYAYFGDLQQMTVYGTLDNGEYSNWYYKEINAAIRKNGTLTIPSTIAGINVNCIGASELMRGTTTVANSVKFYMNDVENLVLPNGELTFLSEAFVDSTSPFYTNESNWNNDMLIVGNTLLRVRNKTGAVTVPDGIVNIAGRAFEGLSGITSVTLPSSVKTIGARAFGVDQNNSCTQLSTINLPNGLKSIADYAFYYCRSITNLQLPNTLVYIGSAAFSYTGITTLTIPNSVVCIEGWPLRFKNNATINIGTDSSFALRYIGRQGASRYLHQGSATFNIACTQEEWVNKGLPTNYFTSTGTPTVNWAS